MLEMRRTGEAGRERPYDLEERTYLFARDVRGFVKALPRTIANIEDAKQLIRSSGSIGANHIEANESLGKKDFLLKIKTSRKEAKESAYWLRLIDTDGNPDQATLRQTLLDEATELMNIFGAIFRKLSRSVVFFLFPIPLFRICFGFRYSDFGFPPGDFGFAVRRLVVEEEQARVIQITVPFLVHKPFPLCPAVFQCRRMKPERFG